MNLLPSENAAIVGTIDPDANAAATYLSDVIDMSKFESIMALVMTGILGASATINAKLVQATTSGGTYKDVADKAIATLVKATGDDKQVVINCRAEEIDVDNGYRYVKLSMTVGTAASDAGAVVLGFNARTNPASGVGLASVAEIVI